MRTPHEFQSSSPSIEALFLAAEVSSEVKYVGRKAIRCSRDIMGSV